MLFLGKKVIKSVLDRYDWIWKWKCQLEIMFYIRERGNKVMQYINTVIFLAWHSISDNPHVCTHIYTQKDFKNRFIIILLVCGTQNEQRMLYDDVRKPCEHNVERHTNKRHTHTHVRIVNWRNPISWFTCQYFCFAKYRFVFGESL